MMAFRRKLISSKISLKILKGMLLLITPRSFTDLVIPFMADSLLLDLLQ